MVLAASDGVLRGVATTSSDPAAGRSSGTCRSSWSSSSGWRSATGSTRTPAGGSRIRWLVAMATRARARPAVRRRRSSTCSSGRPSTSRTCTSASSRSRRWRSASATGAQQHCPVCRAEVDENFLVCPVCTTRLRQACRDVQGAARAAVAGLPVLRDADRRRRPRCQFPPLEPAERAGRVPSSIRPPWPSSRTLVLIKPDAVQRALAGEILGRFERRGLKVVRRRGCSQSTAASRRSTTPSTPRSRSSASSSSSSRRRRRWRSSSRARARSASCGRRWAPRTRPTPRRGRFAATSRSRCRTTSCTAPTRRSRREREIALWFPS